MIIKEYVITAADGIHARPATALIKIARKYKSTMTIQKGEKAVRLDSMLNILALGAKGGDIIVLSITGEDENEAVTEIESFFSDELNKL